MRKPSYNQSGQAVIEYVLMLLMALSIVSIIGIGFRKSLYRIWQSFAQDISAACPGCPPDPKVRLR